ncbi:MAG: metallophosphoesterase family protein [Clostridiales bacterium]|nr:metallophosphoesterase family protein [Clostridiales bacterium]
MKRFLGIFLAIALMFSFASVGLAANEKGADCGLKFNKDGKFTIIQFADMQDDAFPRKAMTMLMEKALADIKPDLVVLSGDNVTTVNTKLEAKLAITNACAPIVRSGIPFTFVFGNHDAEHVAKEYQLSVYQKLKNCITYDPDPSLYGCATHNLEVKNSAGNKTVFNIWLFDSNMYDEENGGYDYIHDDQLAWYKKTCEELANKNNGSVVPSIAFQHIIPKEIETLIDSKNLTIREGCGEGVVGEPPCPATINNGQIETLLQKGDTLGIFVGHDHVNNYIVHYKDPTGKSIDFINTPGIGFQTYGNEGRGFRVITIDENDLTKYDTYTKTFFDYFGNDSTGKAMYDFFGSEVAVYLPNFLCDLIVYLLKTDIGQKIYNAFPKK